MSHPLFISLTGRPSRLQNQKSSDCTGAFMCIASVSYLLLLLTKEFKHSTFLWLPKTYPSATKASMYLTFLWPFQSLYALPLLSPFFLQTILLTCGNPTNQLSNPSDKTFCRETPFIHPLHFIQLFLFPNLS